ncbi:MAG: SLC13 family permease [Planctomycetota bacterium]|jgi:di/tricarboxylate transporter
MSGELAFVFALIGVAIVLMASNKVRFDVVALIVVLALMLSGVLTPGESLAGFGSSVVILVAGLLIVGEMLDRTGVVRAVGDLILRHGGTNETRLLVFIMIAAALLSAVMSSTAVVAIFIPIVLRIASATKGNAARLLLPMSYAALISGMLTLIATTPNIVMHEELKAAGHEGFGFFTFAPVGLAVLAVAVVYIVLVGRVLLPAASEPGTDATPERSFNELWEDFRRDDRFDSLRLEAGSPLEGRTIAEVELSTRFGTRVIGILRPRRGGEDRIPAPSGTTRLRTRDVLLVVGDPAQLDELVAETGLRPVPMSDRDVQRWQWELGGVSVLIHPESRLIGKSLREICFRSTYGLHVLGARRSRETIADYADVKLQPADSLFVVGPWSRIDGLQSRHHDFVVTELPRERTDIVKAYRKLPISLVILVAMVVLTIFNVIPLVAAVLLAALAAVATRCLTMEEAYRSIHWSSIVLLAGMLPLAAALDKTGGTDLIVGWMISAFGEAGPYANLAVIFTITAVLSSFLSNTATAVLVAPIAIYMAGALDVSPMPFAVGVVMGASAAYATPVSSPVVTLVVEPGNYRFMHFVKLGVPLLVLTGIVTVLLTPIIFPFTP